MAKRKSHRIKIKRDGVTPEQAAKGGVERNNGQDINHGNSLVSRWSKAKMLEDTHLAAFAYCWSKWELLTKEPRCTANYDEAVIGNEGGDTGDMIIRKRRAQEDMERITGKRNNDGVIEGGYIPQKYWRIFENCIRFDEPAGTLGSKLHGGTKTARAKAYTVTVFVADLICEKERLTSRPR